ncbi:MAG: hypothetical protein HY830_19210 [Actinobacteria bacterium]|nr:hypothetical protein [Actinomycetota bacterium]
MDAVTAELVAERPDLDSAPGLSPMSGWVAPRFRLFDGAIEALDEVLVPTRRRILPVPSGASLLAASPDLAEVLVTAGGELALLREPARGIGGTWRRPLRGADSATLLAGDRLLVTAPNFEQVTHAGRSYETKSDHRVVLLDKVAGAVLDEAVLDVTDAGAEAIPHPTDGAVVLDLGEGQDGSTVYVVRDVGDRLDVRLALRDVVAASFSPDGKRLLVLPHPSYPALPRVLDWPSLDVIATTDVGTTGLGPDDFDLYGCFLGDDHVLLSVYEDGLWIARTDLTRLVPVVLPKEITGEEFEIGAVMGLSSRSFALKLWRPDHEVTTVWRI